MKKVKIFIYDTDDKKNWWREIDLRVKGDYEVINGGKTLPCRL
jgi:hypothetical protein